MVINYIKNLELDDKITEIKNTNKNELFPEASVILVAYNTNKNLLFQNLESLKKQFSKNYEIIIVDNSDNRDIKPILLGYKLKYIKLNKNYGPSLARNIGIKYAIGNIVIFLDDDAIPAHNFVAEHIRAHKKYDIFGLRGKSLPRTPIIYNYLESHYDYGNKTIPCFINLEGNSSFKRDVLVEIGGFNTKLHLAGGHEGLELTYRIISKYKDKSKLIYYPNAVIYHDYSPNFIKYLKKALRHNKYKDVIEGQFTDILKITEGYKLSPKKLKKDSPSLFFKVKMIMIPKLVSFILRAQKLLNILYYKGKR